MIKKVILISGKAEAGKTSCANIIKARVEKNGGRAVILSYGAYVKHTAQLIFGWDGNKDEAGRRLLQSWGTDYVREQQPSFWVQTVNQLVNLIDPIVDVVIIDDCRFFNELDFWIIKNRNRCYDVMTIRVERPDHENSLTEAQRNHISETELDSYDNFHVTLKASNMVELEDEVDSKIIPKLPVIYANALFSICG